jgi:hypothetical protein
LPQDPSGPDLAAFMVDRVHFDDHLGLVALGIGADGTKRPSAMGKRATPNTAAVANLLVGLRDRGQDRATACAGAQRGGARPPSSAAGSTAAANVPPAGAGRRAGSSGAREPLGGPCRS